MNKIPRRRFIQLSAVAAAGAFIRPGQRAEAQSDLPHLSPDDPQAKALHYTHDASTVDPASRPQKAEEQHCANCAMVIGEEGEWRGCQIFPGKAVNQNGWCSVWAPKA